MNEKNKIISFFESINIFFSNNFIKIVVKKSNISKANPSFFIKDKIIHSKNVMKINEFLSFSLILEKNILKKQYPVVTKYKATSPSIPPLNKCVPMKNITNESKTIYFLFEI